MNQTSDNSLRSSGWIICIGAVLSVLLMLRHPSVQSHALAEALAELQSKAALNRLVHGSLLVVLAATFAGLLGLAGCLGRQRLPVRAGTVFYACGLGCMIGAALINGFVVPALAASYDGQPAALLETLKPVLVLCHAGNQALAQAGTLAMSLGILGWSLALLGQGAAAKWIGWLGIPVGILPALGLLSGNLRLDVHGMGAVILLQAIWNLAVGVWLVRRHAALTAIQPSAG